MVMPSKCPFCGETYSDAEDHISRCPSTYSGACKRFSDALDDLGKVMLDELMKLFRIKKDV